MRAFQRSPAPPLLVRYAKEVGEEYATKKAANEKHRFNWPHREGQSLYEIARARAAHDTDAHCAYCDGFPIDAMGKEELDHFRPKKLFPRLVCEWSNLFFTCSACNGKKLETWDEALLRPDDSDYSFNRYFVFRPDTGELQPNPAANETEQTRAELTIKTFGLNRAGACYERRKNLTNTDVSGPYRFLVL